MKKYIYIIPLLLLSFCTQAATVSWSSTSETHDENAIFSLDIVGLDFIDTTVGGGVNLNFTSNIINVVSVDIDETVWEFIPPDIDLVTIDNTAGTVGIMINTFKGVTGNFIVATVNFQIVGTGGASTDLVLSDHALNPWASDIGDEIKPAYINANVSITPPPIIDSDGDGIDDNSDNCIDIRFNPLKIIIF